MDDTRSGARTSAKLIALWPALPFLGFGFCAAWFALANGTAWLSAVESNGGALTNLLTVAYAAMGLALLAVRTAAPRLRSSLECLIERRWVVWGAGGMAAFGSLVLILIGPAFFVRSLIPGLSHPLFQVASVLLGCGFGPLFLCLGVLYSRLPLRRAILYLCYSHLLAVFIYLAVQVSPFWTPVPGSPSLALMVAFVGLPLVASAALQLRPQDAPRVLPQRDPTNGPLRRPSVYFAVVLLLFSLVQASVTASVTNAASPAVTLGCANIVMLVRVPVLLALALLASVLEAKRFNFSKLCMGLVVLLELLVVLALVVSASSPVWVVAVRSTAFAFELLTWCLLFGIATCHRQASGRIIALYYGVYVLGMGAGTWLGAHVPATVGEPLFYIGCAIVLLPTFLLLGEKNIDGLFWSDENQGPSFEELLGTQLRGVAATRAKGEFARKLDEFAQAQGLSAREGEALRYLVAGRGDNQIAEAMGISYNTARTHVRNVYNKLDVHDRQRLIDVINERLR